jgi:hypothetical protein
VRSFFSDIGTFVRSVVLRWVNLCGGAVIGTIFLWHSAHRQEIPANVCWWILGLCLAIAIFQAWREQYQTSQKLADRIKPRITVSYSEDDEQCRLPPRPVGEPMFRVNTHLEGVELVTNIVARVKAIRKDGQRLPLREPVQLRFHSSGSSGELPAMGPNASEPLDMFRIDSGGFSLALAREYDAFDRRFCNDPGHTYEIDVSINSSSYPTEFTFVCPWTGNFNTTKPFIKPRS